MFTCTLMNIKTNGGKYILWRRSFAFFSIATLLYNFRERRFVLVHHLRGDSSVVAFHIAARPFRSLLFDAALPFRSGAPGLRLDRSVDRGPGYSQSVGRAARCATFVRGGSRSRRSIPRRHLTASASERARPGERKRW